ncbi:MAG: NYN domain-containing protein [Verrucomicrobia bacterium]|nr:NYN domain-containing protein [Verrucomicrobiota bacterium]
MSYFYIDGYNLIFTLTESKHSLFHQRTGIIRYLQKEFARLHLKGMIVFDGSRRRDEESGLSYASPLDIAYAPSGQSADEFILEKLEWEKKAHHITVVSNDRALVRNARSFGAKTQSNDAFIKYLNGKTSKKLRKSIEPKETAQNMKRLLKIFEERLGEEQ